MPAPYSIQYSLARPDWLALNENLIGTSPQYDLAAKKLIRKQLIQGLWISPLFIGGAAFLVGRQGTGRDLVLYAGGALGGAIVMGFMLWGISRLNYADKLRKAALERSRRADFSLACGPYTLLAEEHALHLTRPSGESRTSWSGIAAHELDAYILLTIGAAAVPVPKSAFESRDAAKAFLSDALRWREAAALPPAERIARYLADRDLSCPRCKYNLRGVKAVACPECGHALTLAELMNVKQ